MNTFKDRVYFAYILGTKLDAIKAAQLYGCVPIDLAEIHENGTALWVTGDPVFLQEWYSETLLKDRPGALLHYEEVSPDESIAKQS